MSNAAIVLAADRGTGIRSARVLHQICGRPLIGHVIESALAAGLTDLVVVVDAEDSEVARAVRDAFSGRVRIATSVPEIEGALVLPGNAPLFDAGDVRRVREGGAVAPIGDLSDLAAAEDSLYARIADGHRRAGVTIRGNARIDCTVTIEAEAVIENAVVLRGRTRIAAGARVDVGCVLTDVEVAQRAYIKPYSVCTQSSIGPGAEIGPFSHLRTNSRIEGNARIGNFVETKEMTVRQGAMANHLAFLGDGDLGEGANIGAGTIFCNSDGINKHRTEVGARAFVGSACALVAPVRIGEGAFIATGTTVTRDVPEDALAIGRAEQVNKEGYATRLRERFQAKADGG